MPWKRQLGDFELEAFSDGAYFLDGGTFFSIVPKVLWQKKVKPDDQNRVPAGLNSVLLRTGKKNVLIETGIGNKLDARMQQIYQPKAKLLDNLAAAGVKPEQLDVVINSHLHFDHCGWNTVVRGDAIAPTFPNAKYFAPRGEWEVSNERRERDAVSYIQSNYDPLIQSGQMELIDSGHEILPGISVRNYPGHTRAMMAVMIASGGQTACYISDLIPSSAHLDLTWAMSFDLFPLETISSKKRYYAEAIPQKWLTIFTHDPELPWCYLERDERGKIVTQPA